MKHTGFKVVVSVLLVALLAVEGVSLYVRWQQWVMASAQNDTAQAQLVVARDQLTATQEQLVLAQQAEARRVAQVAVVESFNTPFEGVLTGLMDDYQRDAYQTNSTDTIGKQQLVAAEYNMLALHWLARQNQMLLQLLAGK